MLQIDFLTELFTKAKQNGIHTALDTCGILFDPDHTEKVEKLMAVTDLVLLDIKHMFDEEHKKLTGHPATRGSLPSRNTLKKSASRYGSVMSLCRASPSSGRSCWPLGAT